MQYNELISILEKPAISVANAQILQASVLVGVSALILDNEDFSNIRKKLIDGNNPYAVEVKDRGNKSNKSKKIYNEKNKKLYRTYGSLEDAMSDFVNSNSAIFDEMRQIYDYKLAIENTSGLDDDQKEALIDFIEEYKLNKLDETTSVSASVGGPIVVEAPVSYQENLEAVKDAITDINNDMKEPEKEPVNIPINTAKKLIKKTFISPKEREKACQAGTKIHVLNTNMYASVKATVPTRAITGDYYLYSGVQVNQRYAIVRKPEYVLKDKELIFGYIDYDEFDIIGE